jgi:alpha-L-fucosidase
VAKGGNLLLNVGPDADGNLPPEALQRMEAIGRWLQKNGHAIYGTRPLYPYCEGRIRYTQSKDGKHQYAITLTDEAPYAIVKELKGKARK